MNDEARIRVVIVDDHDVSSILGKLGAESRTEAVALALQHHLVT